MEAASFADYRRRASDLNSEAHDICTDLGRLRLDIVYGMENTDHVVAHKGDSEYKEWQRRERETNALSMAQ